MICGQSGAAAPWRHHVGAPIWRKVDKLNRAECHKSVVAMKSETRLIERVKWLPIHGATACVADDGLLLLRDGKTLDWHLLRWTDPRLDRALVKLTVVARPAE